MPAGASGREVRMIYPEAEIMHVAGGSARASCGIPGEAGVFHARFKVVRGRKAVEQNDLLVKRAYRKTAEMLI